LRILVIEDNADICANIDAFFGGRGWQMDFAHNGNLGLKLSLTNKYDVIVLDIMMPGIDGIQVCEQFRKASQLLTPIIMVTARDTLDDKVKGFDAGADDYLVKPFAMRELVMRIESLARRPVMAVQQSRKVGNIDINVDSFEVIINQETHTFRHLEHKILWLLADAHPQRIDQAELCYQLWGETTIAGNSLRTHIYNVRLALKENNATHTICFVRPNLYFLSERG
jgi:DNA-binding response OmpR family regulator